MDNTTQKNLTLAEICYSDVWRRFASFFIDMIIVSLLLRQLYFIAELHFLSFISIFLYYFFSEINSGKTLGKLAMGLRVVDKNGGKPTLKKIIIRTLCRFCPLDALSFIRYNKWIDCSLTGCWHDSVSDTYVVKEKGNPKIFGDYSLRKDNESTIENGTEDEKRRIIATAMLSLVPVILILVAPISHLKGGVGSFDITISIFDGYIDSNTLFQFITTSLGFLYFQGLDLLSLKNESIIQKEVFGINLLIELVSCTLDATVFYSKYDMVVHPCTIISIISLTLAIILMITGNKEEIKHRLSNITMNKND